MRVSIYLGKDKQWLVDLLKARAAGGKLTGRKTSVGQELLFAAEQYFLKMMFEEQRDNSRRTSSEGSSGPEGHGG